MTEYPSGDEKRDTIIELLCDEWPYALLGWLEWEDRTRAVCRLLDILDSNRFTIIGPPTTPVPPPDMVYPGVPTMNLSEAEFPGWQDLLGRLNPFRRN